MKKVIYVIVGSMLIGVTALPAQVNDTTGTASESRTDRERTESYNRRNQQQQDRMQQHRDDMQQHRDSMQQQYSDRMSNEGMVVVEKNQLPSSLRQTLKDKKYAGWENATIYHNTTTGEYIIAPRAYRFDAQGKEIHADHRGGYGDRMGGNDQYNRHQRSGDSPRRQPRQTQPGQTNPDQSSSQSDQTAISQPGQTSNTQQPSSSYRTDQATQPGQPGDNQYLKEGMVEIQSEQIPTELRSTLRGSQYRGWEEGTLYQEPTTGEYLLVMENDNGTADNTTSVQARTYRFDKNGQLKSDQSKGTNDEK